MADHPTLSEGGQKVRKWLEEQYIYFLLPKEEDIIDKTFETNLFGKLAYNNKNIPNDQKDRIEASKYCQILKNYWKTYKKI